MSLKYVIAPYTVPRQFRKVTSYTKTIEVPVHTAKRTTKRKRSAGLIPQKKKILFVLDMVPPEDLTSKRLLSGATGSLFSNLCTIATKTYKAKNLNTSDWVAISYNAFKTSDLSAEDKNDASEVFTKRLKHVICTYKPDTVVLFGQKPFRALCEEELRSVEGNLQNFFGVPVHKTIESEGNEHTCVVVPTLSLFPFIRAEGNATDVYLLGYVARNLVTALDGGKLKYSIPRNPKFKTIYVDTIPKFKSLLKRIKDAPILSIDTEANNLNRIKNTLLTIQFAFNTDTAYVLPMYHNDTPFLTQELEYIKKSLVAFFEESTKNKENIYVNAAFDLGLLAGQLGIEYFKSSLFDLFAGEFVLDENMKFLTSTTGYYYYSLGNLAMQYGSDIYYTIEFGKKHRVTIKDVALSPEVLKYCALDVIIPLYIREQQIKRAEDIGYDKYMSMVTEQQSDLLHTFATMGNKGVPLDVDYLFYLREPDSPVRKVLEDTEQQIYDSPNCIKANKLLIKESGAPNVGLFGRVVSKVFNISKDKHKQLLFFDVMRLKPLRIGKSGIGKIDKDFQKKYIDHEEVRLFAELSASKKLYTSYVKTFIKFWGNDPDLKATKKIRPGFNFLPVVTGRTSASNPSLHQIPSRSELGKHIKRLFITEEGQIILKVDYSAHEVRCWAIITFDKAIADVFYIGYNLRKAFRKKPSDALAERIKYEGDVHKINAAFFFKMDIKKITKAIRNAVKTVIFGLIYQQGLKGLAKSTGNTEEDIKNLTAKFLSRFPVGVGWFDKIKESALIDWFVESPLGRRRNLWGLMLPKAVEGYESVVASMLRRAVNSPVQGMASDFLICGARNLEKAVQKIKLDRGIRPNISVANSVHDSLEIWVDYKDMMLALRLIEDSLTTEVQEVMRKRHGLEFVIPLEIDFEIGATLRDTEEWGYSYTQLESIISETIDFQIKELGHKLDKKAIMNMVLNSEESVADMPEWLRGQRSDRIKNKKVRRKSSTIDESLKGDKQKDKTKGSSSLLRVRRMRRRLYGDSRTVRHQSIEEENHI